jgi:cyclopropane-fatty-acyl-phospholipid synthase
MSQQKVSGQNVAGQDVQAAYTFLDKLFLTPHNFEVRLWDGTRLGFTDDPRFTLVFNTPGALRRMFCPPLELSAARAYIRGDFDIEGDIFAAVHLFNSTAIELSDRLLTLARLWLALPVEPARSEAVNHKTARLTGSRHSRVRDRAAIQYHYDVGNDFYALWLDKRMVYSCAYFPTGTEDIDTAQEKKLELICHKLQLKPVERLLDIGCGWGGLVIYAAQKHKVNALGVTLSEAQHILANQRIASAGLGSSAVKLLDYRDLGGEQFDKIASVGMFEHVGRDRLPEYFAHVYNLLKPGGLLLNHGISAQPGRMARSVWSRFVQRYILGAGSFFQQHIFPDGELVPVIEVNLIAERTGFEVRHVENLREHYALTLRHWLRRLEDRHSEAVRLTDERTYRTWKLYMSVSVSGFEAGHLNVNQTLLYKPRNSLNRIVLPDSRRCCGIGRV